MIAMKIQYSRVVSMPFTLVNQSLYSEPQGMLGFQRQAGWKMGRGYIGIRLILKTILQSAYSRLHSALGWSSYHTACLDPYCLEDREGTKISNLRCLRIPQVFGRQSSQCASLGALCSVWQKGVPWKLTFSVLKWYMFKQSSFHEDPEVESGSLPKRQ